MEISKKFYGNRLIAQGIFVSDNTFVTQLNNNDMIIGPSGAGKTGGYVAPLIIYSNTSMIITDTKGNLAKNYGKYLERRGFKVQTLNFVDPESSCGYNPLDYIGRDRRGRYSEKDIKTISEALVQSYDDEDKFWSDSARTVVETLIAFVLENLPEEEHNLASLVEVYRLMESQSSPNGVEFLNEVELLNPESITARRYSTFKKVLAADRTWGCINQFVTNALNKFYVGEIMEMLQKGSGFRFETIGRTPTVLFVNVSDSDRSLDGLVNIFYTQCLQMLIKEADRNADNRLRVPVRLVLDDFAASTIIPDFDNLISIIRSRDIYVSVILQSLTQLDSKYGYNKSRTIINNCDHIIYLGGSDKETCDYIANRSGLTPDKIMYMPLDKEIMIERGCRGRFADKVKPYFFGENADNTEKTMG